MGVSARIGACIPESAINLLLFCHLYDAIHWFGALLCVDDPFLCLFLAGDQRVSRPGRCGPDVCDSGSVRNQRSEVNATRSVLTSSSHLTVFGPPSKGFKGNLDLCPCEQDPVALQSPPNAALRGASSGGRGRVQISGGDLVALGLRLHAAGVRAVRQREVMRVLYSVSFTLTLHTSLTFSSHLISVSTLTSQHLAAPGVCVRALATVDGLTDALLGTDESGRLFVWFVTNVFDSASQRHVSEF